MTGTGTPDIAAAARLLELAVPGALGAELLAGPAQPAGAELLAGSVYRVVGPDQASVVVKLVPAAQLARVEQLHATVGVQSGLLSLLRSGRGEASRHGDGLGYLVYPYYPQTLADRIEAGPATPAETATLLSAAADALVRLHLAGLVHADLKPANLLLGPSGSALLADLDGVAEYGAEPLRVTVGFCPPEQLAGRPLAFENDVYSFTALVITLLAGGTGWLADPAGWLAGPLAAGLPPGAVDLLRAGIAADPAVRRVSPQQLVATLAGGPRSTGAPSARPELVVANRQVLDPVPAAVGAPPAGATRLAVTQPPPEPRDRPTEQLLAAAHQTWGFVDLRAVTMDRLALQLRPPAPEPEPDPADRPIWRHPAMLVSLLLAVLLVTAGVCWLMF